MGDFLDQANLLENEDFMKRIKIAIKKVATQIVGESMEPNKEMLLEKRHNLGVQVLSGDFTHLFASAIVANNTDINIDSTDSDLEYMAATVVFNKLAGVKITEL